MTIKTIRKIGRNSWYGEVVMEVLPRIYLYRYLLENGELDIAGQFFNNEEQVQLLLDNCPDTFELTPYEKTRIANGTGTPYDN